MFPGSMVLLWVLPGAKPLCWGSRSIAVFRAGPWVLRPRSGLLGLVELGVQPGAICSLLVWTLRSAGAAPVQRWERVVFLS